MCVRFPFSVVVLVCACGRGVGEERGGAPLRDPARRAREHRGIGRLADVLAFVFRLAHRAVVVSERLEERVKMCEIRSEVYGASDHCPVVMEVAGPL